MLLGVGISDLPHHDGTRWIPAAMKCWPCTQLIKFESWTLRTQLPQSALRSDEFSRSSLIMCEFSAFEHRLKQVQLARPDRMLDHLVCALSHTIRWTWHAKLGRVQYTLELIKKTTSIACIPKGTYGMSSLETPSSCVLCKIKYQHVLPCPLFLLFSNPETLPNRTLI